MLLQVQDRLVIWLKVKKQIFRVDKDYVTLQPSFLRKLSSGEFRPPGFPASEHSAPVTNPWHARRRSEEQKMLHLEEKVLHWLATRDRVTTTEMAEFAYASHEELVPGADCENSFCIGTASIKVELMSRSGVCPHTKCECCDHVCSITVSSGLSVTC